MRIVKLRDLAIKCKNCRIEGSKESQKEVVIKKVFRGG